MIFKLTIYREEKRNLIFLDRGFIQEFKNKHNISIIFKFCN